MTTQKQSIKQIANPGSGIFLRHTKDYIIDSNYQYLKVYFIQLPQ
jgi:hypothetical protein